MNGYVALWNRDRFPGRSYRVWLLGGTLLFFFKYHYFVSFTLVFILEHYKRNRSNCLFQYMSTWGEFSLVLETECRALLSRLQWNHDTHFGLRKPYVLVVDLEKSLVGSKGAMVMEASEIRGPTYTRNSECRFPSKMSRCSLPHDKGLVGLWFGSFSLVVRRNL